MNVLTLQIKKDSFQSILKGEQDIVFITIEQPKLIRNIRV